MKVNLRSANKWLGAFFGLALFSNAFGQITQNFDDITTLAAAGWVRTNNSAPLGATAWSQGSTEVFSSYNGAPTSYISANYNNTTGGAGTISNWLISPEQTLNNGDVITFYTRRPNTVEYADRLQLRLSTNGASSNVGTGATAVGDFTTVIAEVNPTLALNTYPDNWTKYQVIVSGLSGPTQGRVAFRYFVTAAGPTGANSNYIGIDNFSYRVCSAPVVTPSGPTTFCQGGSVTLNTTAYMSTPINSEVTITIGGGTYMDEIGWTLKDNSNVTIAQSPPSGYQESATYKYKLVSANAPYTFAIETQGLAGDNTATYSIACNGTTILTGNVAANGTFTQANLACVGPLAANVTYAWTPGTGLSAANIASPVANPTTSQNYSLLATDAGSGCAKTQAVSVTVNPLPAAPTITPGGPTTFCDGGSVTLNSSAASGNTWSTTQTTQGITASSSGSYTVSYIDGNGCQSPASAATVVTENPLPAAPTITPNGPTTFCDGGSVTLSSSAPSGNVWAGIGTTQDIVVSDAGSYVVYFLDGNGCQSPASVATIVTVNPLPAAPIITPGGPTTFCDGGSVTLTSSSATGNVWSTTATTTAISADASGSYTVAFVDGNGCQSPASAATVVTENPNPAAPAVGSNSPVCVGDDINFTGSTIPNSTYFWTGPNTFTSSNEDPTIATADAGDAGSYSAYVVVNGCTSSVASTTVTISPDPTASFTVSNVGADYSFTNTSTNETSVSWNFGDGSATSTDDSPTHTYNANGSYTVTLTATNACGTVTTTQNVTVSGVSISESDVFELVNVYPNPTDNGVSVSISMIESQEVTFKVFDMQGKLLINKFIGHVQGQYTEWLDLSTLAAGTYQLSLETADSKTVRRIIKR